MKVVVDTNVIAYYLLGTEPFRGEVAAFWQGCRAPCAPASWQAELVNVLWLAVRAEVIDRAEALRRLLLANGLGIASVPTEHLWQGALVRAIQNDHPAYDTLFVELATSSALPLATFDQALLSKFPDTARRPRDLC